MKTETMTINGHKHKIYLWGHPSSPPLFYIHGWMDSGINFQYTAQFLQHKYFCVAPDLRGHGFTEHCQNPLGYFFLEYIADLEVLFRKYNLDSHRPLDVIGHSMGGNILSLYAGAFAEKVRHFINIEGIGIHDTPAYLGPKRLKEWVLSMTSVAPKFYKNPEELAMKIKKRSLHTSDDRLLEISQNLLKKTKKKAPDRNALWTLRADPRHTSPGPYLYQLANVTPFWNKIQAKVLFIQGDGLEMATWMCEPGQLEREILSRLSQFPPDTQRKVIENCGHMIHYERPQELAQLILDFLQPS